MRAIQIEQVGGPDVLKIANLPIPRPQANQAVVRISACGVNFIDVYQREGHYKMALPFTAGQEGAGEVTAVGDAVRAVKPGDRVAWAGVQGSYAEYIAAPADRLVVIPAGVDDRQAASAMLQGMTAQYLTHSAYAIRPGDTVLVHASAGGVGLLLVQMARNLGARVIGTVSTEAKAKLAQTAGADEVILYSQVDFELETKRLTGGKGVQAVYDGVGKDTFEKGLNVLVPRGFMVLFGGASGPVPPFDPLILSAKGSLFLTRPSLAHYIATSEELRVRAEDVLGMIAAGKLKLRIEHTYQLEEAARAHRELEARATTGKLLLLP